ncbi:hypothetical protein [Parasedimentitalea huanghaiensis]|uniref:Uncharacterized protein n=1 Tax=Parasedimentitalea huanghaiensis TaxID=2682100 RepID=A0A6L6WRM5_9RHOB|nr:hypothetical protein [Zongyanglinia huanghaiensis]MVO18587.1 hypothetical protein [Zongyanglinia huanghaiensis]
MICEYAIEPTTLPLTWQRFIYVIEKFGFDRGRLISCLPTEWLREVADAVEDSDFTELQRMKADEKLLWAKKYALCGSGRPLNEAIGDWNANAISAQEAGQVKAVVAAENPTDHAGVVRFDDLTDDHELFKAPNSWEVPRTSNGITSAVTPFITESRAIFLVDPYFHGGTFGPNYTDPLASMLDIISRYGVRKVRFQIHFKSIDQNPNLDHYEANSHALFGGVIPDGLSVELYEWKEKQNGNQFHDRHLLTERGGVTLGAGFCSTDNAHNLGVTLMSIEDSVKKIRRFFPGSTEYDPVGKGLKVLSDGTTQRI